MLLIGIYMITHKISILGASHRTCKQFNQLKSLFSPVINYYYLNNLGKEPYDSYKFQVLPEPCTFAGLLCFLFFLSLIVLLLPYRRSLNSGEIATQHSTPSSCSYVLSASSSVMFGWRV